MAYNPGVENRSGQILGGGIMQAIQSLASGYTERDKQKEQDKIFASRSKATEGAIKSFLPGEKAAEILRVDPKESPEARHGRLLDTVQNFVLQSTIEAKQAEQAERERKARQQATDTRAMSTAMNQFYAPDQGAQIQGGTSFRDLKAPGTQTQAFNPAQFMQGYFKNQGSPESLDKVDTFMKTMMPQQGKPVMSLHTYRDTDAKGNRVDITRDQFTNEIVGQAAAPETIQPEVPNLLTRDQWTGLDKERTEKVLPAMNALAAYDSIQPLLDSDEFISGTGADLELSSRKLAAALGGGDDPSITNTEVIRAQLAVPTLAMLKSLGAGTGVSDTDLKFAERAAGGQIALNGATIKKLVEIGRRRSKGVISNFEERLDNTFPSDSKNESFKQSRNSLLLPKTKPGTDLGGGWTISK